MREVLVTGNLGRQLTVGVAVIGFACAVAMAAHPAIGNIAATLTLVIGVLVVGASQGLLSGLIAATIAFFFFNFFMAEPIMSLRVSGGADLAPFIAFNITAVIAGVLSGKLKDRAAAAERATAWSNLLLEAGNEVQSAISASDIEGRLRQIATSRLGLQLEFYLPDNRGQMPQGAPDQVCDAWANQRQVASDETMALPMRGIADPIGVLAIAGPRAAPEPLLHSYASLAAVALERAIFSERMQEMQALERSEELKSALLSSVSHDFRSPLSVISASASSLKEYGAQIAPDLRENFLSSILNECGRLDVYTANLLQLSKLESGTLLPTQIVDVNDIVVAVVKRYAHTNCNHTFRLDVPIGLLVKANPTLFELAFSNIVANAVNFSPTDSAIQISAEQIDGAIIIEVRDEGIGIPEQELVQVFSKFHRASNAAGMAPGSGLGLAIARGFVTATGGSVWAEVPGIGEAGTTVGMQLPTISKVELDGNP